MRLLILGVALVAAPASAQSTPGDSCADTVAVRTGRYRAGVAEASADYRAGRYAEAADRYAAAFTEYRIPDYVDLYDAASAAALASEVGRAYGFLHRAVETGWEDDGLMDRDPDLAALRAHPTLWAEVHTAVDEALHKRYGDAFDPSLRAELLDIARSDQTMRVRLDSLGRARGAPLPDSIATPLWEEIGRADSLNLARLEWVVAEHGWPRVSRVGRPAAQAAFLVVQHSPLDVQERYLALLRSAVEAGEGIPSNLAYLTDRIRVRRGEPQVYGSQLQRNPTTGALEFSPDRGRGARGRAAGRRRARSAFGLCTNDRVRIPGALSF